MAQRSAPVRRYIEETGLPFHILVDEDRSVTKVYGVWHKVGLDAWNIARPVLFIVSKKGIVRTVWVAERQKGVSGTGRHPQGTVTHVVFGFVFAFGTIEYEPEHEDDMRLGVLAAVQPPTSAQFTTFHHASM